MLTSKELCQKIATGAQWYQRDITGEIPHGDMPGDKVEIGETHITKANTIFPELLRRLVPMIQKQEGNRAVITVCGGSGVGKSEIASLLSYYFEQIGIGSYTLSGDNYPHRIPKYNDAERIRVYRKFALQKMIQEGQYNVERTEIIHELQQEGIDASPIHQVKYPWYESYLRGGRDGLQGYLGTNKEIDFSELEKIIQDFKGGADNIWLKRMGREETELWYEQVDFSEKNILIIEWTHGNSDCYQGVDLPILLHSTPQETLAHRKARNRDGGVDSPFTLVVLEMEQAMLEQQAHKAKIILSKDGEILSYEQYCRQNEQGKVGAND